MRRLLVLCLALSLCVSLCACGSSNQVTESTSKAQTTMQEETTVVAEPTETEPLEPTPEELEIGQSYQVDNVCAFTYLGVQFAEEITATYSSYSIGSAGSEYVLSFDFEYTNLSDDVITSDD